MQPVREALLAFGRRLTRINVPVAVLLTAHFAFGGAPALAQAPHRPTFNATIALGGGSMGLSGLVGAALRWDRRMITLRTTGNLPPAGRPVATDVALLGSFIMQPRHALIAFGTGIALVETGDSSRVYAAPFNSHTQVGVPLQGALLWRPAQGLGLGLIGVANLNARRSFASLLVGLQLGRFD